MLVSKDYAAKRASHLSMNSVRPFRSEGPAESDESANTTNLAVADADGNVVSSAVVSEILFAKLNDAHTVLKAVHLYLRLWLPRLL